MQLVKNISQSKYINRNSLKWYQLKLLYKGTYAKAVLKSETASKYLNIISLILI